MTDPERSSIRLLALIALVGCATPTITLDRGARSFTAEDYDRIYEAWTRSEDDFDWRGLTDILRVTATFESWEYRWAYVTRYARDHSLTAESRESMLRATLEDAGRNHRFFVTMAGDSFRESDLSSRRSAWRVLLVDADGRQTEPVEVQRIRRPSATEEVYFPSVSSFRMAFRLVFPAMREDGTPSIPADAEEIRLRFAGARGRVDLAWRFGAETSGGED